MNEKRSILKPRDTFKPFEYPDMITEYVDPINEAFWLVSEYNFTKDIQDFNVVLTKEEKEVVKRTSLAISQVEVSVKKFWGKIDEYFPKPEVTAVGATFSESEVRHERAYSEILEVLGFNNEFEKIDQIPALKDRVAYLKKHGDVMNKKSAVKRIRNFVRRMFGKPNKVDKDFLKGLILFSIFIENVSLFSQFLIIMSFCKHRQCLDAFSTVVEATSVEENLHAGFGMLLINTLREEHPELFTPDVEEMIVEQCKKAYAAEKKVLNWIFGGKDLSFITIAEVDEFLKDRFNQGMEGIGLEGLFEVDQTLLEKSEWFTRELTTTARTDLFHKRATSYSRSKIAFTPETVFTKEEPPYVSSREEEAI